MRCFFPEEGSGEELSDALPGGNTSEHPVQRIEEGKGEEMVEVAAEDGKHGEVHPEEVPEKEIHRADAEHRP